ncbi:MAG TPA: Hsp20/alpha crystallin family protein [Candidatus Dormibacteraeota bacterium]|nr:Hsp20/alpha crystallin family protein [Candidatus Dormibacteraeota bacterium]
MAKELSVEAPPVNVYESNGQITVAIPMPGALGDTIEVSLDGRRLIVGAESRYAQVQQHYHRHEWSVGNFHRELELPRPVQADGAKATLTYGILTVSLPIGEGGSSRTRITVSEPSNHQDQGR